MRLGKTLFNSNLSFKTSVLHQCFTFHANVQLTNNLYYKFTPISHAIPKKWKRILREKRAEICVIYLDHHLIKNNLLLSLEKLTSKFNIDL